MDLIAAGFRDDIHIGAGAAAIRGVVQAGLHLKFLDGIRIRNRNAAD